VILCVSVVDSIHKTALQNNLQQSESAVMIVRGTGSLITKYLSSDYGAPMIRESQKFISRLLSYRRHRLTREQTVIDHQAAILNYFNSRFGEFFGNCIVTNAQLQPD